MTYGPETPAESPTAGKGRRGRRGEGPSPGGDEATPKNQVSVTFQLQEFKPPRHFVGIDFQQTTRPLTGYVNQGDQQAPFAPDQPNGSYYAGGQVKHGKVRWKIFQSKTSYQVPGYDNFTFGYGSEDQGAMIESGQTILDEKGRAGN